MAWRPSAPGPPLVRLADITYTTAGFEGATAIELRPMPALLSTLENVETSVSSAR